MLPRWSIANGLHLKPTVKLLLSLFCSLQIVILSFAVVSSELHEFICDHHSHEDHYFDLAKSEDHHEDHHDHDSEEGHFCAVFAYLNGIILPEVSASNHWEYSDFQFVQLFQISFLPSKFCNLLKDQRAPPLI